MNPVEVVVLGFKLSDRRRGVRGHQFFFSLWIHDRDLHMPIGSLWDVLLKLVHDRNVFVGQFKEAPPGFFSERGDDTGESATPLRRPTAKLDRVISEGGEGQKPVFWSSSSQLCRIQEIAV